MTFGDEIKRLMATKELTQAQLADAAGCSQVFISDVINGKRAAVGAKILYPLADALGVTADHFREFFVETGRATSPDQKPGKGKKKVDGKGK